MTARIRMRDDTNTLRTIDGTGSTRIRMRDASATLHTITRIRKRDDSNVLRVVYDVTGASSFAVAISPSFVTGVDKSGSGIATTTNATAAATGGTAPYTYAWSTLTHSNATPPSINSPASAATSFRQTNIDASSDDEATFRVTASDSSTPPNTATADVDATWIEL